MTSESGARGSTSAGARHGSSGPGTSTQRECCAIDGNLAAAAARLRKRAVSSARRVLAAAAAGDEKLPQRTKTKNEATGTGVLPHLTDLAPSASYPPKSTSSCASVDGWSSQTSESTITIADAAPAGWRSVPATVDACSAAAAGGRSRSTPPSEAIESARGSIGGRPSTETRKTPAAVISPSASTIEWRVKSPVVLFASVRSSGT